MRELKEPKIFTLATARETLPLISHILEDVMKLYVEMEAFDQMVLQTKPKNYDEQKQIVSQKQQILDKYRQYQREIAQIGCHLKDAQIGLVGYYFDYRNGMIAELCWKYGDQDISYWHEIGSQKFHSIAELTNN